MSLPADTADTLNCFASTNLGTSMYYDHCAFPGERVRDTRAYTGGAASYESRFAEEFQVHAGYLAPVSIGTNIPLWDYITIRELVTV